MAIDSGNKELLYLLSNLFLNQINNIIGVSKYTCLIN